MMSRIIKWVVIIDRTKAHIFTQKPFTLIETFENRLGREKNRALTYDKPGWSRSKFKGPSSTHALTGEKNPHEDAAKQFAKKVGRYLEHQIGTHQFDEVTIVAEPKMMGRLRNEIGPHLLNCTHWIKKDFGHLSFSEVGKRLGFMNS